MKLIKNTKYYLMGMIFLMFIGCTDKSANLIELKHYPLDSTDGLIAQSDVQTDPQISSDHKGSVRITVSQTKTVQLYEIRDIDIEDARLIYQAKLRTENVTGKAYIEMWCHFPGRGEFFSRALHSPLSGTNDWSSQETPFFLKKGEKPDYIKMNIVIEGKGTVWIDDIRLLKAPL